MTENNVRPEFLRSISLRNILSFGPESNTIELRPLNVLIGPNGSGKSNLIETIALLRATPKDMQLPGGVTEWIWKGNPQAEASIDAVITNPDGSMDLRHVVVFRAENQRFHLVDERVENKEPYPDQSSPYFYYRYQGGYPVINIKNGERRLARETFEPDISVLAQRRDPEAYPEISYLAKAYNGIRIYREWSFGRNTVVRQWQNADMRNDRLEEDFSNLSLFLNQLSRNPQTKRTILDALRELYDGIDDFDVSVAGGMVQLFLTEGNFAIPATRLSDGTLRFLCLIAILCDPDPPRLICIEEPELGLHPDILSTLADYLIAASERTQLIVTTHSDILVDALTDHPESVVICEKEDGQTRLSRVCSDDLIEWLEKYRLGELWMSGAIGGTRW